MNKKLQHLPKKISLRYQKLRAKPLLKQGISFFDLKNDWDVLILLDACRYDSFAKLNHLPGKLSHKISLGSCTADWAQTNITQSHQDVIYVSANPFLSNYYFEEWGLQTPFFHLEELWDTGWDNKLNTVHPKKVTQSGLKLAKKHPNKKLVLHYMQPHNPFIGKNWIKEDGWKISRDTIKGKKNLKTSQNVYDRLKNGQIEKEKVVDAYEENLILALEEVEKFIKKFKKIKLDSYKKIIITADHGDCFGEYGVYAHPEKTFIKELIKVPWFKVKL